MSDVITTTDQTTVVVTTDSMSVVETTSNNVIVSEGTTGPQGIPGPTGPAGTNGTNGTNGDKHYETSFVAAQITVTHNLNKYPAVSVVTSAGDEIEGDVEHLSTNQLVVSFSNSFSGIVYCN